MGQDVECDVLTESLMTQGEQEIGLCNCLLVYRIPSLAADLWNASYNTSQVVN